MVETSAIASDYRRKDAESFGQIAEKHDMLMSAYKCQTPTGKPGKRRRNLLLAGTLTNKVPGLPS